MLTWHEPKQARTLTKIDKVINSKPKEYTCKLNCCGTCKYHGKLHEYRFSGDIDVCNLKGVVVNPEKSCGKWIYDGKTKIQEPKTEPEIEELGATEKQELISTPNKKPENVIKLAERAIRNSEKLRISQQGKYLIQCKWCKNEFMFFGYEIDNENRARCSHCQGRSPVLDARGNVKKGVKEV